MPKKRGATKRAKTLTKDQFERLLVIVRASEHPLRDEAALRLSYFAGLRACEIANLRWDNNVLDARGRVRPDIHITGDVAKRSVERTIPIEPMLKQVLRDLRHERPDDEFVFYALHNHVVPMIEKTDRNGIPIRVKDRQHPHGRTIKIPDPKFVPGKVSPNAVVQWFKRLYAAADYKGCTSHSGRRTFVTVRARLANQNQCSIEDVRILAGHKSLETTQTYIEPSEFQRDLVAAW